MPHKKAKRTVREKLRNETGTDLAPGRDSLKNEAIPKSAARVFNSQTVRDEYNMKKRKLQEDDERKVKKQKNDKSVALKIQPGESIQHFNRRVEDDLRPLVKSAVQTSRAVARSTAKAEQEGRLAAKEASKAKNKPKQEDEEKVSSPSAETDKFKNRQKEFTKLSTSAPKRLNDIAQAPPELKPLRRGAASAIGKRDGVLSMAQKVMMEQEREKAIAHYRELKASRRQNGDFGDKTDE